MRATRALGVACGLFAVALLLAVLLKPDVMLHPLYNPSVLLYPFYMLLGLLVAIVILCVAAISNLIHINAQKFIDDAYRIPGTQIVLRARFDDRALQSAPFLEATIGDGPPRKFCMAGSSLTRAQLYSVDGGRFLLETRRDTFLINTAPFSVEGPPHWMRGHVFPKNGRCDYDARSDAPERERIALKAGLKLVYLGAFTWDGRYRRFWPASVSPEQKIAPPFAR
jgi:hypothetical protein